MGDSIGDILYIIVMIIAVVLSIYKKAKGNNQGGPLLPEDEVNEPYEEVFPTYNPRNWSQKAEQTEQHQKQPPGKVMPAPAKSQRIDFQRTKVNMERKRIERTSRISKRTIHRKTYQEQVTEQGYYWDENPMDLKNAVIYAEIIKRPDF